MWLQSKQSSWFGGNGGRLSLGDFRVRTDSRHMRSVNMATGVSAFPGRSNIDKDGLLNEPEVKVNSVLSPELQCECRRNRVS